MWDCKHRREDDSCRRRKTVCFPGGVGCVLKGFEFPLRQEKDPLLEKLKRQKNCKKKDGKSVRVKPRRKIFRKKQQV